MGSGPDALTQWASAAMAVRVSFTDMRDENNVDPAMAISTSTHPWRKSDRTGFPLPSTATSVTTPTTPPTWRAVVLMELRWRS